MNPSTEDRLTAALNARADLVTPEDLGPMELSPRPRGPRRGAVLLLAAAATAAAVAVPFALDGDEGSTQPAPAAPSTGVAEPTPSAAPSEPPAEPRDTIVSDRQRADVDGDGRPDRVQVLLYGSGEDDVTEGLVEATLSGGETSSADIPEGYRPTLLPAFAINQDGREQVLLSHTAGGDSAALLVYTWHDGELVQARARGRAPLALGLDGQGRAYDHYTDDRGLVSWLRQDRVGADPRTYRVKEWVWALDGARLLSTRAGTRCLDVTSEDPPRPCS